MSLLNRIFQGRRATLSGDLRGADVAFVFCVEANRLEPQARLLCESIRRFGGEFSKATIVAVSPRPALAVGAEMRAFLRDHDVQYVVEPLNTTTSAYGSINRIVAAEWAEVNCREPWLVVLDTDTFFASPPSFVRSDAGLRPVDFKGAASRGPGDPVDSYWVAMAGLAGIEPARLPFLHTSIDRQRVRASYNGGFVIARREPEIFATTRRVFFASFEEDLRPSANGSTVHSSTGLTAADVAEWWGSSQAALSVSVWSRTSDVTVYPAEYNIPLHSVSEGAPWPLDAHPVLIHYHYLGEPEYRARLLAALRRLGCSSEVMTWVTQAVRAFD